MAWLSNIISMIRFAIVALASYRAGRAAEAQAVRDAGQTEQLKVDDALLAARKSTDGTVSGAVDAMRGGKF